MKKIVTPANFICLFLVVLLGYGNNLKAQCTNADFETGNLTGWSGAHGGGPCAGVVISGVCNGCISTDPAYIAGFNQGPDNNSLTDAVHQYSMVITTPAARMDSNLAALGVNLPTVWPGSGSHSVRLGNMWQQVTSTDTGDGETMSYAFTVTPANCNFTYHYAVVLNDGGHSPFEQAYFTIGMTDGSGNPIYCAGYQVDATSAYTIGGFNYIQSASVLWKPWTTVFVPLSAYIGQTVKLTFTTRSCLPTGCMGTHYGYAYIDAECNSLLNIASSAPSVCGGHNATLTAPAGAATYLWTGPGIVSGDSTQVVTINQAGHYVVNMTTVADIPCPFSLDTTIAASAGSAVANFTATTVCAGSATTFTDLSTGTGGITSWAWDFTNSDTRQSTQQNPTYTFPTAGTYPVKLTVGSSTCGGVTIINVVVTPAPASTFTATTAALCPGSFATITYTGNAASGDTYNWNFDGGMVISGSGQGPYEVSWATTGTKNVTLTVDSGGCTSLSTTVPVAANNLSTPVEICIVSVDSATGKNIVIWNNPGDPAIDSVFIFKESSVLNVYDNIGGVDDTDFSIFIDTGSNPGVHADRYELVLLDTCGHLSLPGTPHRTIYLTVSAGGGNTWDLAWNAYEGFTFVSYYIYRADASGILSQIDVISSANTNYTDLTPPAGTVYYQVRVENPVGCNPSRDSQYDISSSNIVNTTALGMDEPTVQAAQLFSYNQAGQHIIRVNGNFETYSLKLFDVTGRLVFDQPNQHTDETVLPAYLARGIYVAEANFNTGVLKVLKVVVE